ncbi:MAG: eL32 family ribosomal protein [Candidatus Nanoarchaeia archaeon]|nr:eL32 family ribosomal protein [Candidatus Nanoarchaeia archaeon]
MKRLLQLKKEMKKRKPDFLRQDAHKLKKLKKNWRKPKGLDSKMRRGLRGYRRSARIGFSTPRKTYGLNKDGLKGIVVKNLRDLESIKENNIIILSSTIGSKNRIEILKKIKEKNLKISNIKNVDDYIQKAEEIFNKKRETKRTKLQERKKTREETKKKAEAKKEEKSAEEKLEKEKKKTLEKPRSGKEGEFQ